MDAPLRKEESACVSLGVAIFVLTYVLISARRLDWLGLDRPSGALFGAVTCVALGVLSPEAAVGAVDGRTLLLLFGVMGMGGFLAQDGFFDWAGARITHIAKTPVRLLGLVVWSAGLLSALITNDAVCVLAAPLVVELVRRHRLPAVPFLLALATGANTGSVATLVGNPQNMLCANLGGLAYRDHLQLMGPVALMGLAINHGILWLIYRKKLSGILEPDFSASRWSWRMAVTLVVLLLTALACTLGTDLAFTMTGGCVALLLIHRRDAASVWAHIDWSILLFFAGLFVVVKALVASGAPALAFEAVPIWAGQGGWAWLRLTSVFLVGSNLVSNVPFILVIREGMGRVPQPTLAWELLAMASTFAGNLTFLGSVANVIVAEKSRSVGSFGFWEYLRVGFPVAVTSTLVGLAYVLAVSG